MEQEDLSQKQRNIKLKENNIIKKRKIEKNHKFPTVNFPFYQNNTTYLYSLTKAGKNKKE